MNGRIGHAAAGRAASAQAAGWAFAFATVIIWSGWAVATRFLLTSATLGTVDIVALRFGTAGILLAPYAVHRLTRPGGIAWRRLSAPTLLGIVLGSGFLFSLFNTGGLNFAPAAHGGAMTSPLGAVCTGIMAHLVLNERLKRRSLTGLGLILAGATTLVLARPAGDFPDVQLGHAMFACAGFLWSVYTVTVRRTGLAAMDAVTIGVMGSVLLYVIPYLMILGPRFLAAPASEVAIQAALHGGLGATLSVILFNLGLARLGAARAAASGALVPAMTAVLAVLVLGEIPGPAEAAGIAILTGGVWLVSGARLAQAELAPPPPRP